MINDDEVGGIFEANSNYSFWIAEGDNQRLTQDLSKESIESYQNNIVYTYFEKKKIKGLFDFMVQHLIINKPDNPIEFLKDLTDKLLLWRSGTVSTAPQLFEKRHVEAIYKAMDPADGGTITMEQYHNAFKTLMLTEYEYFPKLIENGLIEKHIFLSNALTALDKNLMKLIRPPYSQLCELTILPNESYDALFHDHIISFKEVKKPANEAEFEIAEKSSLTPDSCDSITSCVNLQATKKFEEDENGSEISAFSEYSIEQDEVSILEADQYDFLHDNKGTLNASEIMLAEGKVGKNAQALVAEDIELEDQ